MEDKYHLMKHHVQTCKFKLEYISTDEHVSNIMTKLLAGRTHDNFAPSMRMSVQ